VIAAGYDELVAAAMAAPVEGWDFSWLAGRAEGSDPSWSYRDLARVYIARTDELLDVDTGGGELLASLAPLPQYTWATEYFTRAISWLRAQPSARGRPIVLYGGSDGTQAAQLLAAYQPHLAAAVVLCSPTDLILSARGGSGPGWTYGGKPLPAGTLIPVSQIRVPVLIGDGGEDPVRDSAGSATTITSLGGIQQANALAVEQFWTHMIAFLNDLPAHQA
jgi:pimeloyl-ACP methyl ester carboxylesterase